LLVRFSQILWFPPPSHIGHSNLCDKEGKSKVKRKGGKRKGEGGGGLDYEPRSTVVVFPFFFNLASRFLDEKGTAIVTRWGGGAKKRGEGTKLA